VYVCVDESPDAVHEHDRGQPDAAGVDLVHELRNRVRFLGRELERKDAILLNMTEAMKAIAPPAPRLVQEKPGRAVEKPYSAAPPREYAVTPTPQPGRVGTADRGRSSAGARRSARDGRGRAARPRPRPNCRRLHD
jgi:hypothetical protein